MAQVFKKRGSWWIDYSEHGRRHRKPIGPSYALAKEALAKHIAEAAERKQFPARAANAGRFSDIAAKFWDLHGKTLRSESWRFMLNRIQQTFDSKRVGDINAADVQRFYNEVVAITSPSTANRHLTLLRMIFNKARAWGDFYGDNPCSMIKKQREAAHRLRYLEKTEIEALLEVAHPRLYPVLVAALHTGMRQGELLGLCWENVSLERCTIYLLQTKSGKPREVPITNKLREVLEALGPKPFGPVFEGAEGGALPKIMLRRYFDRAIKAAKISGFRFHDLRHTFASHFIMRTNDLPALQRLLGHSTPAMTLRYAHLSHGHLAANMATFESGMPGVRMDVVALQPGMKECAAAGIGSH